MWRLPLLQRALKPQWRTKDAVVNRKGEFFTFGDVERLSRGFALRIAEVIGTSSQWPGGSLQNKRIAFLCEPGEEYVAAQFATWREGGCAVPLCITHPDAELEYVVENSEATVIAADDVHAEKAEMLAKRLGRRFVKTSEVKLEDVPEKEQDLEALVQEKEDPAMLIFTSGTTGKPKGVVTRYGALDVQINDQYQEWSWSESDRILNVLPLHHVHGVVNCTAVPLYSGACVEFLEPKADRIWQRFRMGSLVGGPLTVFMAVPTIYSKLIHEFDAMNETDQKFSRLSVKGFRLMVSGSAALPTTVMERWRRISGNLLLERYGMTEAGMILTNPLHPISGRIPGYVGHHFPSVEARISKDSADELQVRGEGIFKEYWNNEKATREAFTEDGWFRTGDIAEFNESLKSYRILGRASADIIKTGGYKVSGIEIEREMLNNDSIKEIAVLGKEDDDFGEVVVTVLVMKDGKVFDEEKMKSWAKSRLASYKIPRKWIVLDDEIPKNAMGKINKNQLRKEFFS